MIVPAGIVGVLVNKPIEVGVFVCPLDALGGLVGLLLLSLQAQGRITLAKTKLRKINFFMLAPDPLLSLNATLILPDFPFFGGVSSY